MRENKTVPLNASDVRTYGAVGILDRLFNRRFGWLPISADISLEGKDLNEEEI